MIMEKQGGTECGQTAVPLERRDRSRTVMPPHQTAHEPWTGASPDNAALGTPDAAAHAAPFYFT